MNPVLNIARDVLLSAAAFNSPADLPAIETAVQDELARGDAQPAVEQVVEKSHFDDLSLPDGRILALIEAEGACGPLASQPGAQCGNALGGNALDQTQSVELEPSTASPLPELPEKLSAQELLQKEFTCAPRLQPVPESCGTKVEAESGS